MVKGSTRDEPSGHPEVNNLQEINQASLLFWFWFRQRDVCFPFLWVLGGGRETAPGILASASLGQGSRKRQLFFTPLYARWSTHIVRTVDFLPKEQTSFLESKTMHF